METELRARAILDEQRCPEIDQANHEFNRREAKLESTVQNLIEQLRPQETELYSKSQDSEKSRQEQYLLVIELWSRESAHQEILA